MNQIDGNHTESGIYQVDRNHTLEAVELPCTNIYYHSRADDGDCQNNSHCTLATRSVELAVIISGNVTEVVVIYVECSFLYKIAGLLSTSNARTHARRFHAYFNPAMK